MHCGPKWINVCDEKDVDVEDQDENGVHEDEVVDNNQDRHQYNHLDLDRHVFFVQFCPSYLIDKNNVTLQMESVCLEVERLFYLDVPVVVVVQYIHFG